MSTDNLWAEPTPTAEQADAKLRAAGPLGEAFADTMREQLADEQPEPAAAPTPNLPAPIGTAGGQLDLDGMVAALPQVRDGLTAALRHAVALAREARGTVVTPEDTFPLVRRLTHADEVLGQWSRVFADAAREARALIEEEALTVAGAEHDGMLSDSLFVPDGVGQRIAVRGDWAPGDSTWDVPSLVGWLVDDEVADMLAAIRHEREWGNDEPTLRADDARTVARNVVARLIGLDGMPGLGRFSPGASAIKALRTKLAELGRDSEAAILAGVRTVGLRTYRGVKITREPTPGSKA